jgi:hypothetical protein
MLDTVVNLKYSYEDSVLYIQIYQKGGRVSLHSVEAGLGDKIKIDECYRDLLVSNSKEIKEIIKETILENYKIKVNKISDFKFGVYFYIARGRGKIVLD